MLLAMAGVLDMCVGHGRGISHMCWPWQGYLPCVLAMLLAMAGVGLLATFIGNVASHGRDIIYVS